MRFHVVGLPFAPTPECAYSGKCLRFAEMMRARGHDVTEWFSHADEWDPERRFDPASEHWRAYNQRVIGGLRDADPKDFICVIAGRCQEPIAQAFPDRMVVEFGVGYGGTFSPFRVFESYAWMHTVYGAQAGPDPHRADGRFYDAVIPNYYDPADFPLGEGGGPFLFMGRLINRKGPHIAAHVCRVLDADLIVAGDGPEPPSYGTRVGVVDHATRAKLMGEAEAVFVPTLYVEPFGGVAAEAMLCGTPVITTDWGAFTETVIDGATGFRCRTLAEFVDAADLTVTLDRAAIREYALGRWSYDAVAPMYERYFARLADLWGDGWYQMPEAARAAVG